MEAEHQVVLAVRIKRRREEPALPSFILGGSAPKRPALAQLSLAAPPAPAAAPLPAAASEVPDAGALAGAGDGGPTRPRVRFKLVGTKSASGSAVRDERVQRSQRLQGKQQASARFQRVATHRLGDETGSATKGVELELRRCAPPKPKLVPFGAPLPPSGRRAPDEELAPFKSSWPSDGPADADDELASVWRDAAMAASLVEGDAGGAGGGTGGGKGSGGDEAGDEFVYDIYEMETEAAPAGGGTGVPADGSGDDEVWWEEVDASGVLELESMLSEHDSQSEDELDYPDEEASEPESELESEADDEGEERPRWARGGCRPPGGATDYMGMVW